MIKILGPCCDLCQALNGAGQYYPSCIDRPAVDSTMTKDVITTALP